MPALRRLEFDVDFPPGHVAAYVYPGREPILFDAGAFGAGGEAALREGLGAVGLEPADIDHVAVTHYHTDHTGQVGTLIAAGDPTIHLPTPFRERMNYGAETVRRRATAQMKRAGLDPADIEKAIEPVVTQYEAVQDVLPPSAVDRWLDPWADSRIGDLAVTAIPTPGHDKTHVSYRLPLDDRVALVSGDMAIRPFRSWIVRSGWIPGLDDAVADYQSGLDALAGIDANRIYPGHGPVHDELGATLDRDRGSLASRLEECATALLASGATPLEVAELIGHDRVGTQRLLPEVVAALAALDREGRARSRLVDGARTYFPA